jgi:hypothetical protein
MIFQYDIARITPSAAVYGRAGCITFHYLSLDVHCAWDRNVDAGGIDLDADALL